MSNSISHPASAAPHVAPAPAGSAMKGVVQSGLARTASFVPTALATLLTSRVIVTHYGIDAFSSFALMISLVAIIPLNDLGVGAAVTSSFAELGPNSDHAKRVLLTSMRVLTVSTLGVAVLAAGLGAASLWPTLLGPASGPNRFVALAAIVFASTFVPGLGQRVLLGLNKNHVTVIVQALFTPIMLALTLVIVATDTNSAWLVVVPPASVAAVSIVTAAMGIRAAKLDWRGLVRRVPWPKRFPGQSIRAVSGPMMLTTLAAPIAFQSDRIVLSHVSTTQAVANYSVAIQLFAPITALLLAAAWPLWPIWAKARSGGVPGPSLFRITAIFTGGAALICTVLVLVANPVGHLIGDDKVQLGWSLPIAAGLSVVMQAAAYPVAMKLMDPGGIRVVAFCAVVAVPVNIGLSVWFGRELGAPGPLYATFLVGLFVQTIPILLFNRRQSSSGRHRADLPRVDELTAAGLPGMPPDLAVRSDQPTAER